MAWARTWSVAWGLFLAMMPAVAFASLETTRAAFELAARQAAALQAQHRLASEALVEAKRTEQPRSRRQALFEQALRAERAVARASRRVAEMRAAYDAEIIRSIEAVDGESQALAQQLTKGALTDRRQAALRLQKLRSQRRALLSQLQQVRKPAWEARPPGATLRDWSAHADLLDDVADKLRRRAAKVQALLTAALDQRALETANARLRRQSALFGESTRPDRVLRGVRRSLPSAASEAPSERSNNGGGVAASPGAGAAEPPTFDMGESDDASGPAPTGGGGAGGVGGGGGATDGFVDSGGQVGVGSGGQTEAPPAPSTPSAPDAPITQPVLPRDLGALLASDPELVSPSDVDPEQLEAWLAQLEAQVEVLTSSAAKVRAKAAQR